MAYSGRSDIITTLEDVTSYAADYVDKFLTACGLESEG